MIIQAKDHRKSADINIVGAFASVIQDVRASRGVLICSAGFTKGAKEFAKNRGIDLYPAHDASEKDWQSEIRIPVIRSHSIIEYKLMAPVVITKEMKENTALTGANMQILEGPDGLMMKKFDGTDTSFIHEFIQLWNQGKITKQPGKHKTVFNAYLDWLVDKKLFAPKLAELEYFVKVRNYLKFFSPTDYRGLKNFVTEKFTPSFIQI